MLANNAKDIFVDYLNALTHAQYIQILVNVVSMPICRHRCLHVFMADPNCFHEAAHLIFFFQWDSGCSFFTNVYILNTIILSGRDIKTGVLSQSMILS